MIGNNHEKDNILLEPSHIELWFTDWGPRLVSKIGLTANGSLWADLADKSQKLISQLQPRLTVAPHLYMLEKACEKILSYEISTCFVCA